MNKKFSAAFFFLMLNLPPNPSFAENIGAVIAQPQAAEVARRLHQAGVSTWKLGDGRVVVTSAAGRVVAMAFAADGESLLWSHPQLIDTATVRSNPEKLTGGFGGDRLWFAPELDYHWDGEPDWQGFANYKPPAATDPGAYQVVKHDAQSIALRSRGELPVHGAKRRVGFEVERTIRMTPSPLASNDPLMQGVDYVGIEAAHHLQLADKTREGVIDLWHLLQVPTGSTLLVPFKKGLDAKTKQPLSYGLPGGWVQKPDHIRWRYGGEAKAKLGLAAAALTGRSAVLRPLASGRWALLIRDFPVDSKAGYGDYPYGQPRTDQAFQAWDGYGFGEMEFHSPALDAQRGPRKLTESDRLWAFGGSPVAIAAIAKRLLEIDVTDLVASNANEMKRVAP